MRDPHLPFTSPLTLRVLLVLGLFFFTACHRFIDHSIILHPRQGASCSSAQEEEAKAQALSVIDEVASRMQFKPCDPPQYPTVRCYYLHPERRSQGQVRIEARQKDDRNLSVRIFQWALLNEVSEYTDVKNELEAKLTSCCSECLKAEIYS